MASMKSKSKKMIPLKYSCEEVYERMEKGLCIFCEENDSPEHQKLKHKGIQIVCVEDDQLSEAEEISLPKTIDSSPVEPLRTPYVGVNMNEIDEEDRTTGFKEEEDLEIVPLNGDSEINQTSYSDLLLHSSLFVNPLVKRMDEGRQQLVNDNGKDDACHVFDKRSLNAQPHEPDQSSSVMPRAPPIPLQPPDPPDSSRFGQVSFCLQKQIDPMSTWFYLQAKANISKEASSSTKNEETLENKKIEVQYNENNVKVMKKHNDDDDNVKPPSEENIIEASMDCDPINDLRLDFSVAINGFELHELSGLQLYHYGETILIPLFIVTWRLDSFYESIKKNHSLGLHTLLLLDIRVHEEEFANKNAAGRSRRTEVERYEDMVKAMKKIAGFDVELTIEERNLLSVGYKNVMGAKRASWRILSSTEQKEESKGITQNVKKISAYRTKVEDELSTICYDIWAIIDKHLLPFATSGESFVFYYKMKGDYFRYLAEFKSGADRDEAANQSLKVYEAETTSATSELSPTHPIRLGLALSFAVFYYEILNSPERVSHLAKQAFDEAEMSKSSIDVVKKLQIPVKSRSYNNDYVCHCNGNGKIVGKPWILRLVFGGRSVREIRFNDDAGDVSSVEIAELAGDLLDVKWSTNIYICMSIKGGIKKGSLQMLVDSDSILETPLVTSPTLRFVVEKEIDDENEISPANSMKNSNVYEATKDAHAVCALWRSKVVFIRTGQVSAVKKALNMISNCLYKWRGSSMSIMETNHNTITGVKAIEESKSFYRCLVEKSVKLLMNVPFTLEKSEQGVGKLEAEFIKEAAKENVMQFEGHRSVGEFSEYHEQSATYCVSTESTKRVKLVFTVLVLWKEEPPDNIIL